MKTGEYEHSAFVESVEAAMQGIKVEKGSRLGLIQIAGEDQGDGISQCVTVLGDGSVLVRMLACFIEKHKALFSTAIAMAMQNDSDE